MRITWLVRLCSGVRSYAELDVHSWPARGLRTPLAVGRRFSIFWPSRLMRLAGMTLPGNWRPVRGSMIGWIVPFVIRVCVLSRSFSRDVGMFVVVVGVD